MTEFLNTLSRIFTDPGLLSVSLRILTVLLLAWLVSRVLGRLLPRVVFAVGPRKWRESFRPMRRVTLRGLIAGITRILAFTVALIVILSMFFEPSTVLTVVGLFSAAFGLGARPVISDMLTGIILLFEDQFSVGEKVELSGVMGGGGVIGTIERVAVRTSHVRADSGELFIVPNGDVRVGEALAVLQLVGREANEAIADIIEEPMVISETGMLAARLG